MSDHNTHGKSEEPFSQSRRKFLFRLRTLVAGAVLAPLLVGCGEDDDQQTCTPEDRSDYCDGCIWYCDGPGQDVPVFEDNKYCDYTNYGDCR